MNISSIVPHATSNDGSNPTNPAQDTNDMFLQLLTAQLKDQSPLDPVDPNQFATQLVQFNMLDQLIQINQTLKADSPANTTHATSSLQGAR